LISFCSVLYRWSPYPSLPWQNDTCLLLRICPHSHVGGLHFASCFLIGISHSHVRCIYRKEDPFSSWIANFSVLQFAENLNKINLTPVDFRYQAITWFSILLFCVLSVNFEAFHCVNMSWGHPASLISKITPRKYVFSCYMKRTAIR